MPAKKTTDKKAEMSFEQSLERLNVIADVLENQNPSLEEALALYAEGAELIKDSAGKLKDAEAKITLLSKGE